MVCVHPSEQFRVGHCSAAAEPGSAAWPHAQKKLRHTFQFSGGSIGPDFFHFLRIDPSVVVRIVLPLQFLEYLAHTFTSCLSFLFIQLSITIAVVLFDDLWREL